MVILVFAVSGLWYLGGSEGGKPSNINSPATLDDKLIALVQNSPAKNGRPLLDPSASGSTVSAFRLTLANLAITKSSGVEETRHYGETVSQIFQNVGSGLAGAELKFALEAFKAQSSAELATVKREAERYGQLAIQLKAVPVPDGLKNLHLNLLNAVLALAETDLYLAEILTEPMLALDRAQSFASQYENLVNATTILNQVLASHNLPIVASL